jgi:hypothetical protein
MEGKIIKKMEWFVWLTAYCLTSRFYMHAGKMASKGQACGWLMAAQDFKTIFHIYSPTENLR